MLLAARLKVDHGEVLGEPHLVGGQADPGRGIHRPEHVGDGLKERLVDARHARGLAAKNGVAAFHDGHQRHKRVIKGVLAFFVKPPRGCFARRLVGLDAERRAVMQDGPGPIAGVGIFDS